MRRSGGTNGRFPAAESSHQEDSMAKGQKRSNREIKKPKKEKLKTPATAGASSTISARLSPSGRNKAK
jgi:hypothetical protein